MRQARRWKRARAEHERELEALVARIRRLSPDRWQRPRASGKWSPAEETLHIILAYELARTAADEGRTMRMLVSPSRARLLRWTLLPLMLATGWFPTGVTSPREVEPGREDAAALSREGAVDRLRTAAEAAASALASAGRRSSHPVVTHAYFGPLSARRALRLLSAHTRHHRRRLARVDDG